MKRNPPPRGTMLLIGSEDVEVYPQFCGDGHRCIQCFFNGKYLCSPRYWFYPTLEDCPGYPLPSNATRYQDRLFADSAIKLSSVNQEGIALRDTIVGLPPVEMPDGGFVAELTEIVMSQPVFTRRVPYRITEATCNKCGYGTLKDYRKPTCKNKFRETYQCPQCGSEQKKDTQRLPYTVKLLARELQGRGFKVGAIIKQIQQGLGVTISGDTCRRYIRGE